MNEFYQIQKNLISFLERTISFSFVRGRTFDRDFVPRGIQRPDFLKTSFVLVERKNDYEFLILQLEKKKLCMNFSLVEWKKW